MNIPRPLLLVTAGMRAALVLVALVAMGNLATRLAFTTRTIQARVDEAVRQAPGPAWFGDLIDAASTKRLRLGQR